MPLFPVCGGLVLELSFEGAHGLARTEWALTACQNNYGCSVVYYEPFAVVGLPRLHVPSA